MSANDLPVNRWGNSLAVRIPARLARELGVAEGDMLHAEVLGAGHLALQGPARPQMTMEAFLARVDELHRRIPLTQPVVAQMRCQAR